jgi:hypothetical protein
MQNFTIFFLKLKSNLLWHIPTTNHHSARVITHRAITDAAFLHYHGVYTSRVRSSHSLIKCSILEKKKSVLEYIYNRLRTNLHARLKELWKSAVSVLGVNHWRHFLYAQAALMIGRRWNRMNNLPGLNIAKRPKVNIIMSVIIRQEVTTYRGNQRIDFFKVTTLKFLQAELDGFKSYALNANSGRSTALKLRTDLPLA